MKEMRKEIEAWGVTYERYALGKELRKLKKDLSLQSVAEMPAHGAKAMPSIYSIGFGLAGTKVTLINAVDAYRWCWNQLGLLETVEFLTVDDLYKTNIRANSFDFVWNFAYLSIAANQDSLIKEMKRISKRYIGFFSVNYGNIGFHVHRAVHKANKVPWSHGDVYYNRRRSIVSFMERHGLRSVKKGFVDCPIWPDSLGFRDMRLHRENVKFDNVHWQSPYIDTLATDRFPLWVRLVYAFEKVPNFAFLKSLYAHINYVVGQKP